MYGGRKRITRDMIEACLEKGWSKAQAARHYGFHPKSIEAACERFGIMLPMSIFSPQIPASVKVPRSEVHVPKRKSNAVWSCSPAAIQRALLKQKERI
jgi:hypothetical protein